MTTAAGARAVLHVDMDAFFAAVEVLKDPSLRGKPLIVGGSGERGVVASCSYEARAYGIRSAMPSVQARRLCPHAIFVHGSYEDYAAVSRTIHDVFRSVTPLVEGIALDEAFLDVSGARRLHGEPEDIGWKVRADVEAATGLTCSVGVATSKLIAKLASEEAKPRAAMTGMVPGSGVFGIEPGEEVAFLHPLPVRALWGVGPATHRRLARFGVETVGDLARVPVESLVAVLGRSAGRHLHDLAWARDARPVVPAQATKSIGHEETYGRDLYDEADVRREVIRLSDSVASRLRAAGLACRTVTLKVRYADFQTITRSHSEPAPVDTGPAIATVAEELLEDIDLARGVRLLGVSGSNLAEPGGRQLTFDDAKPEEWERAAAAIDSIRDRFGDSAVGPAALLAGGRIRAKRRGDQQWGPSQ
jgi:DNA polymerase-4